jgi:hypothetical protein
MASMAAMRSSGVRSNHWRGRPSGWWSLRLVKTGFMADQALRATDVNARRLNCSHPGIYPCCPGRASARSMISSSKEPAEPRTCWRARRHAIPGRRDPHGRAADAKSGDRAEAALSASRVTGISSLRVQPPFDAHLLFYRGVGSEWSIERMLHGRRNLPQRLRESPGAGD